MNKTNPVATPPTSPLRWYVDYHLPANELVLVDGAAGVGKSLYFTYLIRLLTQGDHLLQESVKSCWSIRPARMNSATNNTHYTTSITTFWKWSRSRN